MMLVGGAVKHPTQHGNRCLYKVHGFLNLFSTVQCFYGNNFSRHKMSLIDFLITHLKFPV